jgi:hypothetical protein
MGAKGYLLLYYVKVALEVGENSDDFYYELLN